jgi:hypothetical protein
MKIRDIIGEEAKMVVKDFKPGVSLSMVDPATDTMTTVDLKKNPTAVQTDPEGKFMYDPTPDSAAPGEPKQPELKPGAEIAIDTTIEEDPGVPYYVDVSTPGKPMAKTGGRGLTAIVPSKLWTEITPDIEQKADRQGFRKVTLQFAGKTFIGLEGGDKNLGSKIIVSPKDYQFLSSVQDGVSRPTDPKGTLQTMPMKPGQPKGTLQNLERMDESAIITALARKIAGTEVKVNTKSKEVFDIKKLAGL